MPGVGASKRQKGREARYSSHMEDPGPDLPSWLRSALGQRVYALEPSELVFVGRPDIVVGRPSAGEKRRIIQSVRSPPCVVVKTAPSVWSPES